MIFFHEFFANLNSADAFPTLFLTFDVPIIWLDLVQRSMELLSGPSQVSGMTAVVSMVGTGCMALVSAHSSLEVLITLGAIWEGIAETEEAGEGSDR